MKSLQLHKPHVLVVVGLPGAGKTFFATQFSDTFSAPYLDYGHYRQLVGDETTADKLADDTLTQLLRTKQTIIVEGRGSKHSDRRELVKLAHKSGYDTMFVWVQTEPVTAEQRSVRSKSARMTANEFDQRAAEFEILTRTEPYLVISGKHTYPSQAKIVLKKLVAGRTATSPEITRIVPPRGRIMG